MARRLSGSVIEERSDYLVVRTPDNPGFWWGNFLLMPAAPSLADAGGWRSWYSAEFPGAQHRSFGLDSTDGRAGDPAALATLGVETQVNAVLAAATLREPEVPDLELRAFDNHDWEQLSALRSSVYPTADDEPTSAADVEFAARQVAASQELVARGHGAWLGAFDAGRLVAALGIVSDRSGTARYQAVETHPDHRRRGLARRLVYEASVLAADRFDAQELVIVADPEDHALTLYESLGFAIVELQVELTSGPTASDD
jgi:ribosomal protein S18 acetylase RimI-like enzyme